MRRFQRRPKTYTAAGLAGLEAKRNGADAESQIEMIANVYLNEGKAEICKRYEPYRRVSGGAKSFKAVYAGKAGCDFELWLSDGRSGHMEMKSREADRISKSAIDDTQRRQLERRAAWGHLAFVVVRLRGVWYRVDWARWEEGDRKSHNAKQLQEIGVLLPLRSGLPDLLHGI
jgi:penicillin-binding protein-related factor A (putative recombinase)